MPQEPMDKGQLLDELRIDRQAPQSRGRASWFVGGGVVLLLIIGAIGWMVARDERFDVEAATAVAPASQGGATAILQATGYVTARRQATVSAQITGTLTEVLIEEGEQVKAGQVLARLENTAQRARVDEARAQVEQARAQVKQFESQYAQAQRDDQRQLDLVERKLVSQQAAESARTQAEALAAQLTAQQRFVDLALAQLRSAQVQLDYTTVRAPFAGVITAKAAQVGEIVSPLSAGGGFTRTGIGTIVDMDSLEIEVDVNESYINRVKAGGPAEAVLDAYPDLTIPAHVIAIVPTADRSKATVKVRVGLEQKDPRILPDMGARVSFLDDASDASSAEAPKGVLVPGTAVVQRDGKTAVFLIEEERARAQPVTAGQTYSDLRLVQGVVNGAQVVRDPPAQLRDGSRIRIGPKKE